MSFTHIPAEVRREMYREVERDHRAGCLYLSEKLTGDGKILWPELLMEAICCTNHLDLAQELKERNLMRRSVSTVLDNGDVTVGEVSCNAHEELSLSEFIRFYLRAHCVEAIRSTAEIEISLGDILPRSEKSSGRFTCTALQPEVILPVLREGSALFDALGILPHSERRMDCKLRRRFPDWNHLVGLYS